MVNVNKISKIMLIILVSIFIILCIFLLIDLIFYMFSYNINKILRPDRYNRSFLLENYKYTKKQKDIIKKGENRAKKSKVVIYSLCRNISKIFNKSKKQLENIGKLFKDYKIIIFENDSNDKSRELLKKWENSNKNIILLDCCEGCDIPPPSECCDEEAYNCKLAFKKGYDLGVISKSRVHMMKNHRNKCLKYVKENFSDYDYLIAFDFDIEGGLLKSGVYHTLGLDNWDAIFANGRSPNPPLGLDTSMYDSFAYRDMKDSKNSVVKNWLKMRKLKSNVGDPLIKVKSAFNGLGFYKIPSVINSEYKIMKKPFQCEHVGLHDNMINKGFSKLYINPSLLLYAGFQGPSNKWKALPELIK